jgi:hypothetical protein
MAPAYEKSRPYDFEQNFPALCAGSGAPTDRHGGTGLMYTFACEHLS